MRPLSGVWRTSHAFKFSFLSSVFLSLSLSCPIVKYLIRALPFIIFACLAYGRGRTRTDCRLIQITYTNTIATWSGGLASLSIVSTLHAASLHSETQPPSSGGKRHSRIILEAAVWSHVTELGGDRDRGQPENAIIVKCKWAPLSQFPPSLSPSR